LLRTQDTANEISAAASCGVSERLQRQATAERWPLIRPLRSDKYGWHFLTRLKCNRQVNPDDTKNQAAKDIDIPAYGRTVHLKGFGFIQVFRTVASNGDAEHWATDDLKREDGE